MYGRGEFVVPSIIVTGAGVAALPHTSGNPIATVLATVAITLGVSVLFSQLVVRVLRKKYSK